MKARVKVLKKETNSLLHASAIVTGLAILGLTTSLMVPSKAYGQVSVPAAERYFKAQDLEDRLAARKSTQTKGNKARHFINEVVSPLLAEAKLDPLA
ncbi:hypothetical protein OAN22_02590, partial [Alphaproteobacteria bacterium]|nr:hypothetical protein [Alphaproteobacteria bacterium]